MRFQEKTNAMKALAREQCEAAAQLQRHQQHLQQQQQHHQQQQQRSIPSLQTACPHKLENMSTVHSIGAPSRGSQYQQQQQQQQQQHQQQPHHLHHHHHLRHISMSPPLLLSSPSGLAATHNHLNISTHRGVPTTPPASPGDRSPTSPANKHNRSQQHLSREATGSVSPGIPAATLDLSSAATTNSPHELSTLV